MDVVARDITGDHDHRRASLVGQRDARDEVGGAGPGGRDACRGLPRSTGVAVRHEGRALFVPGVDEADIGPPVHLGDDAVGGRSHHADGVLDALGEPRYEDRLAGLHRSLLARASAAESPLEELAHRLAAELGALEDGVADTREHLFQARADLPLPDLLGALLDPPGLLIDLLFVGSNSRAGNHAQNEDARDGNPYLVRASSRDAPPSVRLAQLSRYHRRRSASSQGITRSTASYTLSSAFFILRIASMCSRGERFDPIVFTERWVAPRSCHSRARRVHSAGPPME